MKFFFVHRFVLLWMFKVGIVTMDWQNSSGKCHRPSPIYGLFCMQESFTFLFVWDDDAKKRTTSHRRWSKSEFAPSIFFKTPCPFTAEWQHFRSLNVIKTWSFYQVMWSVGSELFPAGKTLTLRGQFASHWMAKARGQRSINLMLLSLTFWWPFLTFS